MKKYHILNPVFKKALNLFFEQNANYINKIELIDNLINISNKKYSEIQNKKKEQNAFFLEKVEYKKIDDEKCKNLVKNILDLKNNNKIIYKDYVKDMKPEIDEVLCYELNHQNENKDILNFHNMIILSYIYNTNIIKNGEKRLIKIKDELKSFHHI